MRLRITVRLDAQYQLYKDAATFAAEVLLPWGTEHPTYPGVRLIQQPSSGQIENAYKTPNNPPPVLLRVYETIPENDRVIVGEPGVSYNQYGFREIVLTYIQLSAGTTAYTDTVGTSAAPAPYATAILKTVDGDDNGTIRTYKLTYTTGGEMADDYTLNFGGNLIIRTRTFLNQVPPTPAGYTLFGPGVEYVLGLPLYRYRFSAVNGGGVPGTAAEIGRSYYNAQGGTVQFNPANPTTADGTVKAVIEYITALSVTTNPIPLPSGFVLVGLDVEGSDGYKKWTGTYYFADGLVVDEFETHDGGKLITYHRVSYGTAPTTPSATIGGTVTEIESTVAQQDGYVRYEKRWAEGVGEISRDIDYGQSVDEGTTGVTRTSIRYIVAPGDTVQPTSLSGSVLIKKEFSEGDGYRIWSTIWAKGAGTVDTQDDTKYNGALLLRTIIALGSAPATPSGYTIVTTDVKNSDGYVIYTTSFAKGVGEISRDITYGQSVDEGVAGTTNTAIRYIVAPAGTIQPTSLAGSVLIKKEITEGDGYRVWSTVWAKGAGMVLNEKTIQAIDALVVYHRVGLGGAGVATTGDASSNVLTQTGHGYANGDEVYFTSLTGGAGLALYTNYFVRDVTTDTFKLALTPGGTAIDFTTDITAPSALVRNPLLAPSATIGGTVTLFEDSIRADSGYTVCDRRWAEGDGQSSITTDGEPDGALVYTVVTFTAAATTPAYPGSGTAYLVRLQQQPQNGYFQNTAVYKKPPATITLNKKINFTKPGSAVIGGSPIQLSFTSPVTMDILASVEVSYSTSQISDVPFTVSAYAEYYETYTPTDTGIAVSSTKALGGYLGGASGTSGTNSVFNGILCDSWSYQLGSSTPSSFGSGAKVLDVDNDPYLVATDGTVVYRRTKVSYTF